MHWDGDVTGGIMLRDGGSRNAVFRLFVFVFPVQFYILCSVFVQQDRTPTAVHKGQKNCSAGVCPCRIVF